MTAALLLAAQAALHTNIQARAIELGYDPAKVSGYAFGFGVERIAMIKYGIPDIRWLYENDVRFLSQLA